MAIAAIATEDLSSVLRTHLMPHTHLQIISRRSDTFIWPPHALSHAQYTYVHTSEIYTYNKNKQIKGMHEKGTNPGTLNNYICYNITSQN